MATYIGKVNVGGSTLPVGSTLYGTCGTAANTAAKVVTMANFDELITGVTIHVKFTYSNTVANPTLNVNSTGAKSIYRYGTTAPSTSAETSWNAGAVVSFTYDGSYWQMNDWVNDNTKYTAASATPAMDGTAAVGTSTKYAREDHVHPSDTSRVPTSRKVNNKALSADISLTASDVGAIATSAKGAASGVAELDANGKVPSSQLPSFVDDVLEYNGTSSFPTTGEAGKIYVDTSTNKTYRWGGSSYTEISASLALGETSSTAYRGDRGKTAYTHATDSSRLTTATASGLYKVAATAEGHIASLTAVAKSDITALGIPSTNTWTAMTGATSSANGTVGYVNAVPPKDGYNTKYLRADGTWSVPPDNNTTYGLSISDHTVSLVAGGTTSSVTVPDNNDNNAVTQTATTTSADYEVLFSSTADNTTRTEGARKNSNMKFNPNTGNLQVTQINGVTVGSSPKFTDNNTTYGLSISGHTVSLVEGGTTASVTVPDNNDNNAVTQTATSTSANYEVLFSATADNTTRTEGARKNNNLTFNPNTGNLQVTQINGVTVGSSPKFTDNNTTYGLSISGHTVSLVAGGTTSSVTVPDDDTTYESKTAASGGTDVSLVTTGEKYTWNNKLSSHQTIKQDGVTGATVNRYGACTTAAATAAKTVSVTTGTFNLEAGARVSVKFNNANTANSPTLNVNSKGAKNIFHKGAQITSGGNKALLAGICDFIYDGTQWHLVGNYIDTNTTYTANTTSIGSASGWNAGSVPSLSYTSRSIPNVTGVGTVPTLAYTARSVGSASGWSAGTAASASVSNGVLTITNGTAPSLTVTSVACDDITSWDAGSTPTLGTAISADDITAWDDGSVPSLTVTSTTVATGITAS